jgi:hypothetical protein
MTDDVRMVITQRQIVGIILKDRRWKDLLLQMRFQYLSSKSDCNLWRYNNSCQCQRRTFPSHHIVRCNKVNKFSTNGLFYSKISALERSTSVDTLQVFDIQNSTEIDEDTTIPDNSNGAQFHTIIMFVVTTLITPQPLVCSNPPDQR